MAEGASFDRSDEAIAFARRLGGAVAVKADGLAGGKGVSLCQTMNEAEAAIRGALDERVFGEAGSHVVVEADRTYLDLLVGNLLSAVRGSTASLRSDGTVVFAGGYSGCYGFHCRPPVVSFAELFAAESEGFTATGPLVTARDGHTATVLGDGSTVLVAGGLNGRFFGGQLASAELYK